ncbi:MAG TPA: RluA family pseudouridine synthase [Pseudobacteroides sp.]|uniref:RluA family pseudouridine synthase n=1 Tax=Pseudobacteroides sp. TaxID=1968840 RepID=UPI002F931D99
MILKYTAASDDAGKKLKVILKSKMSLSERLIKRLKNASKIYVDCSLKFVNHIVSEGETVEVHIDFEETAEDIIPEDIPLDIIYEDEYLIAINKQPGIVVHPTCSHPTGTIANGVMLHFLKNNQYKKIRPVSRLDRDTSGVIVFAKNEFIQEALIKQMHHNSYIKEYIGIVSGIVESTSGTIDLPIARKPGSIMLRHISEDGVKSVTHYAVLKHLTDATLLKFNLETGRTHQIRVHCQAIGHPLIGDTLYSDLISPFIDRQALHSHETTFNHPIHNHPVHLKANIPQDINKLIISKTP